MGCWVAAEFGPSCDDGRWMRRFGGDPYGRPWVGPPARRHCRPSSWEDCFVVGGTPPKPLARGVSPLDSPGGSARPRPVVPAFAGTTTLRQAQGERNEGRGRALTRRFASASPQGEAAAEPLLLAWRFLNSRMRRIPPTLPLPPGRKGGARGLFPSGERGGAATPGCGPRRGGRRCPTGSCAWRSRRCPGLGAWGQPCPGPGRPSGSSRCSRRCCPPPPA